MDSPQTKSSLNSEITYFGRLATHVVNISRDFLCLLPNRGCCTFSSYIGSQQPARSQRASQPAPNQPASQPAITEPTQSEHSKNKFRALPCSPVRGQSVYHRRCLHEFRILKNTLVKSYWNLYSLLLLLGMYVARRLCSKLYIIIVNLSIRGGERISRISWSWKYRRNALGWA